MFKTNIPISPHELSRGCVSYRNEGSLLDADHPANGGLFARRSKPGGGTGELRRVIVESFTWGIGRMLTGFDIEARAIRSFEFDKIVKWLPVPEEHRNAGGGRLRRRGGLRRGAMFRRLASSRFLKTGTDDQGFWVGFTGKVSQIADVHQHGLRDRSSLRAKAVPYPRRELLGATPADRERLLDALYELLSGS